MPEWRRTGNAFFPLASLVDGEWWVLRINAFPDHPMWTLLVDGRRQGDFDDLPPAWGKPLGEPLLEPDVVPAALERVLGLEAYGSEVGQPCDNPFCCG